MRRGLRRGGYSRKGWRAEVGAKTARQYAFVLSIFCYNSVEMLKVTERALTLRSLENTFAAEVLWSALWDCDSSDGEEELEAEFSIENFFEYDSEGSEDLEDGAQTTEFLHACMDSERFLQDRRQVPKVVFPVNILDTWPEYTFKQKLRMSPSAFHSIVGMISQHFVFSNNSHNDQASSQLQFAVAMYRFGRSGNGASRADVAGVFGISPGSVTLFTNRVMIALLSLESVVVHWPGSHENRS